MLLGCGVSACLAWLSFQVGRCVKFIVQLLEDSSRIKFILQLEPGRIHPMVRPESWIRPAGVSPVWVGTGAPSSRPRFVGEIWRAERGVESLFGGSKIAGRSVKRTLQPRHRYNGGAEPVTSRRRPCLSSPVPGSARRVLPGYGRRHVITVWHGTGETRLPGLRRAKTTGISQW